MASDAAWSTDRGGLKSGSPTQREVTVWPSASICLTREKISTVLEGLIWERSGFRLGSCWMLLEAATGFSCKDFDAVRDEWRKADGGEKAALREECDRSAAAATRDDCFILMRCIIWWERRGDRGGEGRGASRQ